MQIMNTSPAQGIAIVNGSAYFSLGSSLWAQLTGGSYANIRTAIGACNEALCYPFISFWQGWAPDNSPFLNGRTRPVTAAPRVLAIRRSISNPWSLPPHQATRSRASALDFQENAASTSQNRKGRS